MQAGIALGSNVEPRLHHLQTAAEKLRAIHIGERPALVSSIYETSPVDCVPGTAAFLNAVVEIEVNLSPEDLLNYLKAIEIELGRPAIRKKNSPRTVDLDLLYGDREIRNTIEFQLPHPRIAERLFVLRPLLDIRPALVLPNHRETILDMVTRFKSDEILVELKSLTI